MGVGGGRRNLRKEEERRRGGKGGVLLIEIRSINSDFSISHSFRMGSEWGEKAVVETEKGYRWLGGPVEGGGGYDWKCTQTLYLGKRFVLLFCCFVFIFLSFCLILSSLLSITPLTLSL